MSGVHLTWKINEEVLKMGLAEEFSIAKIDNY